MNILRVFIIIKVSRFASDSKKTAVATATEGDIWMSNYRNDIEQFIYEICYRPMWEEVSKFLYQHPQTLDLTFSRIQYPDSALLEDMILEFPSNIRIKDDNLLFDAVVSCNIELTEESESGIYTSELHQWLIVSCDALIANKLENFKVDKIKLYKSGSPKDSAGQAVSSNIVPIIYKKDLDDIANEFLAEYYPEALVKPVPVPIADIAEKMGLTILQGYRISDDFSIFGEICFSGGHIEAFDLFKSKKYTLDVRRGTILIDAYTFWERNLGCVKNTIAHEVFHWYRHRMYAAIKQILRKEKLIACRCPAEEVSPSSGETWTDEQRMEWQANSIAPRILMPINTFRQKVDELYSAYNYESSPIKPAVLTCIADDLASFYGVSRQSALIRMMETSYKEAASIYQYNHSSDLHSYVDRSDAFYEYCTNLEFRELVDSGLFLYVDGYFVINNEKYIEHDDNGALSLTTYAWGHLSECTLQFKWRALKGSDILKHLPSEILHRANADRKTSAFETDQNEAVIQMSEELRQKREEFERQNSIRKITAINKTCWQLIYEIIQSKGLSKTHFCSLTNLGEEVYRKAEKNIGTNPSVRTIVAIARGLDLNLDTTESLMRLAGHAFGETDEDQALKFCITGFSGQTIEDANEFLESYNYEPLGTKQRL